MNPATESVERTFFIVGTGRDIDRDIDRKDFVGTYQLGPIVLHVFELVKVPA